MGLIFKDDFHDEFGTWPIAYIPYGGADFGEMQAVARAIGDATIPLSTKHGRRPATDLRLRPPTLRPQAGG
jgi:hypothetical protein